MNRRGSGAAIVLVLWLMAFVIIGTVVTYFLFLPPIAPRHISVVVLPFVNQDGTPDHALHGLSEEIRDSLSRSRDIVVISSGASFSFASDEAEAVSVVDGVGASHFVDGYVDPGSEARNLTVRLVNASQPALKQVWSTTIDLREVSYIDARDEIAANVRTALYDLGNELEPAEKPVKAEAYEAYLRALSYRRSNDFEAMETAINLSNSIEQNAYALTLKARFDGGSRSTLLKRALAIDSAFLSAQVLQAEDESDLVHRYQLLFSIADRYPNYDALLPLARLYRDVGRHGDASQLFFRWSRIESRSARSFSDLAKSLFRSGKTDEAGRALRIAASLEPSSVRTLQDIKRFSLHTGRELETPMKTVPGNYDHWLPKIAEKAESGDFNGAKTLLSSEKLFRSCDELIVAFLYVNDADSAIDQLNCADRSWKNPPDWWQSDDPRWMRFVADERYDRYLSRNQLDDESIAKLQWRTAEELLAPRR